MRITFKELKEMIREASAVTAHSELPEEWSQALGDLHGALRLADEPDNPTFLDSYERTVEIAKYLSKDSHSAEKLLKYLYRFMDHVNAGTTSELDMYELQLDCESLFSNAWNHAVKGPDPATLVRGKIKHACERLLINAKGGGLTNMTQRWDTDVPPETLSRMCAAEVADQKKFLAILKDNVPGMPSTARASRAFDRVLKAATVRFHTIASRVEEQMGENSTAYFNIRDDEECIERHSDLLAALTSLEAELNTVTSVACRRAGIKTLSG